MSPSLPAATLIWDNDADFANGANDGAGTWNTLAANWRSDFANTLWDNAPGDIARFGNGGTGGTVTLSGTLTAGGLEFAPLTSGAYTLSGGGLTLTTGAIIDVDAANATLASALTASGTVVKTGTGNLNLSGTNILGQLEAADGVTTFIASTAAGDIGTQLLIRRAAEAVTDVAMNFAGTGTYAAGITVVNSGSGNTTLANTAAGTVTLSGPVNLGATTILSTTGATRTMTVAGVVSGAGGITKSGAGIVQLTGVANTFGGPVVVNAGTLRVARWANGGLNSSLGTSSAAAANLTINGGTLGYITGTSVSTDRQFTLGIAGGSLDQSAASGSILTFANTADLTLSGSGTRTLTLSGTRTGVLATRLLDPTGGLLNLTKTGTGTWSLTHAGNTQTGVTTVTGGTLQFSTVSHGGLGSAMGTHAGTAAGLIVNGTAAAPAYWGYSGTVAGTTDRLFTVGNSTAGAAGGVANNAATAATLTLSATGPLAYGSANQTRTVALGGTNTGVNTFNPLIQDNGTGAVGVLKSGTGRWVVAGANTYTGVTTVSGGTLQVASLADGGITSAIGASASAGTNLVLVGGGILAYAGTTAATTNRLLQIGTTATAGAGSLANNSTAAASTLSFTNPGALVYGTTNQTRTFTLRGTNTGNNTFAPLITNNGTGVVALTKADAGRWILTGANTYTGITTVSGGTLQVASLANGGVSSGIGAATAAAANLVFSGASTLAYTGAGTTTNRAFTLGTTGAVTLLNNGTGDLTFSATTLAYGTTNQARSLTLGGTAAATNTFAAALTNNGTGLTALSKTGTTTWALTGAHTYTGATSVAAGKLFANGSATGSAHTISSSATLGGIGTVGAITLNTGASLSPGSAGETTVGTLTATTLTWANGATLRYNLDPAGISDRLTLTGALVKSGTGTYGFDFLNTGTTGTYTLISGSNLTAGFSSANFSYTNLGAGLTGAFDFNPTLGLHFTVVPEPASMAFAGTGLLVGLLAVARRRRRSGH